MKKIVKYLGGLTEKHYFCQQKKLKLENMLDVKETLKKSEERMEMAAMFLEDELNRITNELRAIRENQPKEVIHVDTVRVTEDCPPAAKEALRSHVTFTIGSSRVTELEEMNVMAIAEYLQKNPNAKAVIYGYADNGTGNDEINHRLAKQRADAVSQLLTGKYGVSSNRVQVNSMQNREQAFTINNWNRVVVVTANE